MINEIEALSARLGSDFFLTQGAGGNISYKEGGYLYIKKSGEKMSDALKKNIFLTLPINKMREEVTRKNFSYKPVLIDEQLGKPSIEFMFHVVLSQRIVVHLHPIELLSSLVLKNAKSIIEQKKFKFEWGYLPYCKPGADIAQNIYKLLLEKQKTEVFFLQNHGVIIGADNIKRIEEIIGSITSAFHCSARTRLHPIIPIDTLGKFSLEGYEFITDNDVTDLVLDEILFGILKNFWALYPDQVLFLGGSPVIFDCLNSQVITNLINHIDAPFIFLKGVGILRSTSAKTEQDMHLKTFYEILIRLPSNFSINTLNLNQVNEIINWEDEIYRKNLFNCNQYD